MCIRSTTTASNGRIRSARSPSRATRIGWAAAGWSSTCGSAMRTSTGSSTRTSTGTATCGPWASGSWNTSITISGRPWIIGWGAASTRWGRREWPPRPRRESLTRTWPCTACRTSTSRAVRSLSRRARRTRPSWSWSWPSGWPITWSGSPAAADRLARLLVGDGPLLGGDELQQGGLALLGGGDAALERRDDVAGIGDPLAVAAERAGQVGVVPGDIRRPVLGLRDLHDRYLDGHGEVVEQ